MALIVEYFSFFLVVLVLITMVVFYREMDETNENEEESTGENGRSAESGRFQMYTDVNGDQSIELIRAGSELNFEYTDNLQFSELTSLSDELLPSEDPKVLSPFPLEMKADAIKSSAFPFKEENIAELPIPGK